MTKLELAKKIANKTEITQKAAAHVVDAVLKVIQEAIGNQEEVRMLGFGTFSVRQRAQRQGRDLRTGEAMTIPAKKVVVFKPGKDLREAVSQNKG